mgnify:CR=1 FL=1
MSYDSLEQDQLSRLISASRQGDFIDKLVVIFTGYIGLRVQEIRHLKASWIDFQRQEINMPAKDEDWPPDAVKARPRTIPYGDLDGKVKTDIEYYFRDHDDLDISKATIYNRIESLASEADIRTKVTPKKLRHTAAKRWVEEGEDIMGLQELMGYETLEAAKKFFE